MDALLVTTFMKPHSSPDTNLGHKNEPVTMQSANNHCKFHSSKFSIDFSCTVGILCNFDNEHLHESPDFLLVVSRGRRKDVAFANSIPPDNNE